MEGIHQIERDKTSLHLSITAVLTGSLAFTKSRGASKSVQFLSQLFSSCKGSKLTLLCEVQGIWFLRKGIYEEAIGAEALYRTVCI